MDIDYISLMDEQIKKATRLNVDNYMRLYQILEHMFRYDKNPILLFERNDLDPEGRHRGDLTFKDLKYKKHNLIEQLELTFSITPPNNSAEEDFIEQIQVDTFSKSKNSHKARVFSKKNAYGLYLMDDFHPENTKFPHEKLYVLNDYHGFLFEF